MWLGYEQILCGLGQQFACLHTCTFWKLLFCSESLWSQFLTLHNIDMALGYLGGKKKKRSIVFLCINLYSGRLMWIWEEKNNLAKWLTSANPSGRNHFHKTVKLFVREFLVPFSDMSIACWAHVQLDCYQVSRRYCKICLQQVMWTNPVCLSKWFLQLRLFCLQDIAW